MNTAQILAEAAAEVVRPVSTDTNDIMDMNTAEEVPDDSDDVVAYLRLLPKQSGRHPL